ncbi:MAG: TIGR02646 family protein [Beggiatoa sp. IS2]|nr:MAG: TIGR02646 family protein [Beggiatoa sp. IS2]
MRYIDKSDRCLDFDNYIRQESLTHWDQCDTQLKLVLHQHLWREQQGLCIYCQQQIPPKKDKESSQAIRSHIEHVRPRTTYPELTFVYCNLSVSCEGFDCKTTDKKPKKEFCEHRKADEYDEDNFLNPMELKEIEDYFFYDIEGKIHPHPQASFPEKANYMIKILDLNHSDLIDMRKRVYEQAISGEIELISAVFPPFCSMLKQFDLI